MSDPSATALKALGSELTNILSEKQIEALSNWNARILSDEAPIAFGVQARVEAVRELLFAGRSVALIGARGVGKTTLAREAFRRLRRDGSIRPAIQLSVRRGQAKSQHHHQLVGAFEALGETLVALDCLPFFEDGDLLRGGLVEPLMSLVTQLEGAMVIEGTPAAMNGLFEDEEELDEHFVRLPIEEPDIEATQIILQELAAAEPSRFEAVVDPSAREEAIYLAQRFLSRSHFPRKAIDLLSQTVASRAGAPLDREHVIGRFCELHDTPRWLVDPRAPLDFSALEQRLRDEVLGQSDAVAAASRLVATMKTGLSDLRRPFGAFLFTGPTGVGKTHLAQTLAHILFGGRDRMVRVNMGDYATDPGSKLFGDSNAYSLPGRRGTLTQLLLGRQFAVLLLDELEKAHEAIFDRLLPLMDEGVFDNGAGETISCRSMIIIATTNAGAEVYRGAGIGFAGEQDLQEKRRLVDQRVKDIFRFEFLNRFDDIVHFDPLSREACRTIARWELERLRDRVGLRRYGLELTVDETVLDWLAVHGYHPDFGARFLKRTIERSVTRAVAEAIVRRRPPEGSQVELLVRGRKIHCRIEPKLTRAQEEVTYRVEDPQDAPRTLTAAEILDEARPLLAELEHRENERASLLDTMGAVDFWGRADHELVLDRFRELDVSTTTARRFAYRIEALRDAPNDAATLAAAADALRRWQDKARLAGPKSMWLMLSCTDAHEPASDWLRTLVRIEQQYCRRCDLEARIEAVELRKGQPVRAVLEVEGPGTQYFLTAEVGLHRLHVSEGPDRMVHVQAILQEGSTPKPVRPRSGRVTAFDLDLSHEVTLKILRLGLSTRLFGRSAPVLGRMAVDIERALADQTAEASPARLHGQPGGVVTDPRTGVRLPARQVEKGRLEPFLEAYLLARRAHALTWS